MNKKYDRKIYFDSSAYTKIFSHEDGSNYAKKVISLAKSRNNHRFQILLSDWTIHETIAAIDQKYYQRHEISKEESDKILATIFAEVRKYSRSSSNIVLVYLSYYVIKESVVLIHKLHISSDDALHLFTAYIHGCNHFLCKDNRLKERVNNHFPSLKITDITNKVEMRKLISMLAP